MMSDNESNFFLWGSEWLAALDKLLLALNGDGKAPLKDKKIELKTFVGAFVMQSHPVEVGIARESIMDQLCAKGIVITDEEVPSFDMTALVFLLSKWPKEKDLLASHHFGCPPSQASIERASAKKRKMADSVTRLAEAQMEAKRLQTRLKVAAGSLADTKVAHSTPVASIQASSAKQAYEELLAQGPTRHLWSHSVQSRKAADEVQALSNGEFPLSKFEQILAMSNSPQGNPISNLDAARALDNVRSSNVDKLRIDWMHRESKLCASMGATPIHQQLVVNIVGTFLRELNELREMQRFHDNLLELFGPFPTGGVAIERFFDKAVMKYGTYGICATNGDPFQSSTGELWGSDESQPSPPIQSTWSINKEIEVDPIKAEMAIEVNNLKQLALQKAARLKESTKRETRTKAAKKKSGKAPEVKSKDPRAKVISAWISANLGTSALAKGNPCFHFNTSGAKDGCTLVNCRY